jgi:hypothetical protein
MPLTAWGLSGDPDGAPGVHVGLGPHAEDVGHELGRIDLSHLVSFLLVAHIAWPPSI